MRIRRGSIAAVLILACVVAGRSLATVTNGHDARYSAETGEGRITIVPAAAVDPEASPAG